MQHQLHEQVLVIILVVASAAAAHSQPSVIPAGKLELVRLVDLTAERLGINIEYDDSTLEGAATLRLDAGVTDQELWRLVNRLLAARGLTVIYSPGDAVYSVVRPSDAAQFVDIQAAPPDPLPGFMVVLQPVQHRPANDIATSLTTLNTNKTGTYTAINDHTLLIADLTARLDATLRFIALLDVPGDRVIVEEFQLTNLTGDHGNEGHHGK